jgi:hypothetical protein
LRKIKIVIKKSVEIKIIMDLVLRIFGNPTCKNSRLYKPVENEDSDIGEKSDAG